jgi:uncharacterized membrane protein
MRKIVIRELTLPAALSILAGLLLLGRILYTGELRFLFLVWNLFLAFVPYLFSVLAMKHKDSNLKFWGLFGIWMLFFPNAPYILTDFIHLKYSSSETFIIDIGLIGFYSVLGLYLGALSLQHIFESLKHRFSPAGSWAIVLGVILLSGIGIYLGRFIRWNSWDILHAPHLILEDIWMLFRHPSEHVFAWKFSFIIAIPIFVSLIIYQRFLAYVAAKKAFLR